jgi:hypothetical protein
MATYENLQHERITEFFYIKVRTLLATPVSSPYLDVYWLKCGLLIGVHIRI